MFLSKDYETNGIKMVGKVMQPIVGELRRELRRKINVQAKMFYIDEAYKLYFPV